MTDSRSVKEAVKTSAQADDPIFTSKNVWYFRTQTGDTVGPFRYRSEAESNLDRFMKQLKERLPDSH
ncbi:MAG: DUF6316 family protein [Gammaproteobacteria bacterium]|nr:DUF6316 family protein [Gammaproteobacteria bacterium]